MLGAITEINVFVVLLLNLLKLGEVLLFAVVVWFVSIGAYT